MQVEVVVFDGPPQPFNEDVVLASAASVHADSDPMVLEDLCESVAGKLGSLIRVEDLRFAVELHSLLEGLIAEIRVQGVGDAPGEDLAAVPIHDRHQIHKPTFHGNVGDISGPHLIRVIDGQVPEQVGVDPVLRMGTAGVWLWVDT
jgi:hypothetical protein